MKSALSIAALLSICLLSGTRAQGSGVVTDCSNDSQLQAAVASGGMVTFTCSGTIPLTAGLTINANTTIDGTGQQVALDEPEFLTNTVIVNAGAALAVNNLTIQNSGYIGIINNGGILFLTNSVIAGSQDQGIFNSGTATITNSLFYGNHASAVYNIAMLTITSSTLFGNSRGLFNNGGGNATIANSIIAQNTAGNCFAAPTDGGYNLADDGSCSFTATGSQNSVSNLNLGPLAGNGGYTQTMIPGTGSPAIAAIPPGINGCATGLSTDQIGQMRPGSLAGYCSIGAYEVQAPIAATITNCTNDSQLQSAAANGGRIVFACSGDIPLTQTLQLPQATILDGTGQSVTLDAQNQFAILVGDAGNITLNNLTFTRGLSSVDAPVFAVNLLIVLNSTFASNQSSEPVDSIVSSPFLLIVNSTFTNNAAAVGVIPGSGFHLITNSTFFNNTVSAQTIDFTLNHPINVSNSILNCTPNCGLASSLAYNGGSTNTLALPSGSSDIGAIPFLSRGCGTYLISDQRGVPRIQLPASGPPACDLGAYQTTQNNTALTFIAGDLGNPSYSVGTQYSLTGTNVLNLPFGTLTAISAPATQMVNGIQYTFASWSDGGAAGHTITVPPATAIYAAEFTSTTPVIPSANNNYVLNPVSAGTTSPDLLHYYINSSVASVQVLTQGIPNLDFTLLSTDCTDAPVPTTCSVVVNFTPQAPGLRMGAVEFLDASNNVLGTSYISGIGFSAGLAFNSVSPVTPALNGVTAPTALAVDAAGNLYVADLLSGSLLKFAPGATTASSTIALPPGEVRAIVLDGAGTLYLSNLSEQIYKFPPGSTTPVSVASGDAIAVDGEGNLYASFGDSVTEYPASGAAPVVKYSGSSNVSAIALDAAGDLFVQTQGPGDSLTKVAAGSGTQTTILTNNYTPLNSLAADAAGDVFGIMGNAAVEVPHGTNSPIKLTTGGFTFLALDSLGNLWISNGTTVQEFPRCQPPALTFGSANVSTTVGPQTISAQNIGNQPLTVTGFSTDPNFSGISACTSTAPGAFCNLSFTFAPTEAGSPLTGSLVPTDDVLGATQPVFPLSGTGLLIPQSITFDNPGPQVVGIPLALIATANSGLNVTYQSTTPAVCAVPVSTVSFLTPGTCTITASQMGSGTYAPATLVTQTFNVAATVTPSAPNNGAFFGTFAGNIAVTTVTFTFDTTETLSSTPYVVLTQGAQNLDFQAPSSAQLPTACAASQTYNAGNTCTVTIFFAPTKTYQRIGSVQLMGSSGTPIATFNLAGMGLGPQVLFPSNSAVTTLASGFVSPYGLALDGTGNVYVADTGNGIKNCHTSARCGAGTGSNTAGVYQIAAATGTLNTIGQGFGAPAGVAVDGSGNLFVADPGNGAVYEVVAVNGVVSSTSAVKTIGSVNGNFSSPTGVALDASGDVFVVDPGNSAVYEIVAVNGVVTANSVVNTLGNFTFNTPTGVALDSSGDIFVADSGNNAVYEIVAANGLVTANSLVNTIGTFTGPTGVALDGSGNLYVAAPSGTTTTLLEVLANNGNVSSSSTVVQLGSGFNGPYGVAVDARGNIFIADTGNHLAKEIDRADPPSLTFASTDVGSTSSPQSVIVQNIGDIALTGVGPGLTFGTFVQVPGSGTPADCAENFVLTYGQQCNLSISFIPTTVGPLSGTATFTDNALDASPSASQVIQLSGTGLQAGQSIVFNNPGTQVAGTPLTLNALASSGLPVSFSATGQCTLNGSVVTFSIPGTCSITASQSGNSNYTAAAPVTQNFTVEPQISPSPNNSGALPATAVNGTPAFRTFNYTVNGGKVANVLVLTQGIQNLDFTLQNTNCIGIADGSACGVSINFIPKAPGLRMGAIELLDNNNNILNTTYVSGVGEGSGIGFNSVSPVTLSLTGITAASAVYVDLAGNLYVADSNSNQLLTFAPGATTPSSRISLPGPANAIALDGAGKIYLAISNAIYELSRGSTIAIGVEPGNYPAVDSQGNLYVAGSGGLIEYPASGATAATQYPGASTAVIVSAPLVFVVATGSGILSSDSSINLTGLTGITGIVEDAAGDLYIAEAGKLLELPLGASSPTVLASGSSYNSLALDGSGNIWIANGTTVEEFPRSQPPALIFASTNVSANSSDSPKIVSAQNIGNLPLTVTGFSANPNFSGASACSSTMAGAFCNLGFTFAPTQAGPLTASLSPNDNVPGSNGIAFALSGTGIQIAPTVTFTGAPSTAPYQSTFTISATTNSGVTATITTAGSCSISGTTVTMTSGTGLCKLNAQWAAGGIYQSASLMQMTTAQTIAPTATFTGAPKTAAYQSTFAVSSTTNSGVTPTITASGSCSVSGSTISMTSGTGTCNLQAVFAATSNYSIVTLTQATNAQTIAPTATFTGAPKTAAYQSTFAVSSTTNSGVTPTITASGSCSVSGSTISMTSGTGTCSLQAVFAATSNYSTVTLTQATAAQTVAPTATFTGAPASAAYQSTFAVSSTINSGVTPTITGSGSCSISGSKVTMTSGTGACNLQAAFAATSNYSTITLTQSTTATPAAQTVTIAAISSPTALDSYTLSATSTTSGTPTFSSSTTAICTVSGSKVSLLGTGTCTITATVPATTNYMQGAASYSFSVAPPYTITADSIITTVIRGTIAAFVLDVHSLGVFKGNVTLSCSGGPAGTVCQDFPMTVPVNPTGLAASGFLVATNAATGTYTVTFTGVSGQETATTSATITVK